MLKYVKMILLVGALSAVISGCIDSKDPDFQISAVAYVIQKNDGPEQTMKTFGTYVAMGGAYGTVVDARVTRNGMLLSSFNKLDENFYETRYVEEFPNISNCNGDYLIEAVDEEGNVAQSKFTFNIDKSLGALRMKEPLKYENGRITAQWEEVENATAYGILVGRGVEDNNSGVVRFYRINASYCPWEQSPIKTTGVFDPSTGTGNNTYLPDGTELIVAVVAAYQTSSQGSLYLEGDYYKIVLGTPGVTPIYGFN